MAAKLHLIAKNGWRNMGIANKLFEFAKTDLGQLLVGTVFENFSGLLPVNIICETDKVVAFWHPKPFYKEHILVIPKKKITSISTLSPEDGIYLQEVFVAVKQIVKEMGWDKSEYSVVTNGGKRQETPQLHFHLFR